MVDAHRLDQHPFFKGFDILALETLAPLATVATFRPGELLIREGDPAKVFFLLEQGKVALEIHVPGKDTIRVETAGQGDVVGLSWMFPPKVVHLDARVIEEVTAIQMDAVRLRAAMESDNHLGYMVTRRLLHVAYDRLERVRIQRLDMYAR